MPSITCRRCAEPFAGKRSDAVFCGDRCRDADRQARWRRERPERARAIWRRYSLSEKGTVTVLLQGARDRSRQFAVPYDLDAEWLAEKLANGVCELSGLPLERVPPTDCSVHPFAPSLDRKDPALGYVKGNVRIVCFAVNRARSDWGDDVLMQIAHALVSNAKG